MKKVYTKIKWGKLIRLNQCPSCGGIWFDKWELYPITKQEAKKINKANVRKLRKVTPIISTVVSCPKCHLKLTVFKDPNLPSQLQIDRCNKCGGLWLNRGELQEYKKMQEKKTKKAKESFKIKKSIKAQLKLQKSSDTLFRIGDFLSTHISTISLTPIKSYDSKENIAAGKTTMTIMAIVETLMKLLVGKI
jgi:Zn-finger nucleic acid-binding protein